MLQRTDHRPRADNEVAGLGDGVGDAVPRVDRADHHVEPRDGGGDAVGVEPIGGSPRRVASLVDRAEAALDAVPETDPAGRIMAWGETVREWAVANPAGFKLIYGDPVLGYQPPSGGPAREAELRACSGLVGLAAAAWPHAATSQTIGAPAWPDFDPALVDHVRGEFPDLPPAGLALALRMWGRMHGLLALEIYGHLGPRAQHPDKLYRAEMLDLVRSLGLRE
ncbi:TetR-like C-terminal domain-containing protein [Nocardia salmonicida]|uniref:TetR-like C-terminal domain-containing protein n=1 Tax=Nocardia salmonicida TaxID=53431 RepID=UPI0036835E18